VQLNRIERPFCGGMWQAIQRGRVLLHRIVIALFEPGNFT